MPSAHDMWVQTGVEVGHRMAGYADQGTHSLLGAVELHKCHATGPPVSVHHKVDAIRAYSVPGEEPASHLKPVSVNSRPSIKQCTALLLRNINMRCGCGYCPIHGYRGSTLHDL